MQCRLPHLRAIAKKALDRQLIGLAEFWLFPERRSSWGGPFNGQRGRQEWFLEVVAAFQPEAIVETGAFRGTTTRFLASLCPPVPVFSVELSSRAFGFARANLRGLHRVELHRGDSREYLSHLVTSGRLRGLRTLYYLDAHWGPALPLVGELERIFVESEPAVVAVDDFQVPDDPGYGYDDYGPGQALTYQDFALTFERLGLTAFAPQLPSKLESGERRGMTVLARNPEVVATLESMNTLRRPPR